MNYKKSDFAFVWVVPVIALAFVLFSSVACGAEATPTTAPAPAEAAATPAPAAAAATATPAPAEATPAAAPVMAEALANLNLRDGPGTEYSVVDKLPTGSQIIIIGRNEDGSWLLGKTEKGEEVWLSGEASLIKVDPTQITKLTVAKAPPLPYNVNNKQVNDVLNMIPLVVHHENKFACASHGGLNKLLPEVAEGNVIGPHANDFIYKGDNVLFKYTGGTFVLIKENPIARFENGEESLSFARAMQLFESGDIVWNGKFGDLGRGVHGCDLSAP